MKYNFEIKRGCIVYKDGARVVLLDTGCVRTISAEQDVQGEIFPKVNKFVDPTVDQILGMDSISQRVFIDYPKNELVFGENITVDSPIAKYDLIPLVGGLFAIYLKIGGEKRKMLLDTGAATSYLAKSIVIQGKYAGKIKDFFIGEEKEFETDIYSLPTECGTESPIDVNYGVPKDSIEAAMEQCNVDGIIGYEWLRHFKVLLDIPNRCLILGK